MSDVALILIVIGLFLILLISGLYIHSVLLGVGVIGFFIIGKSHLLSSFLGGEPYNSIANYTLTTIPLFVLMAQFILNAGIVKDLFLMVYNFSFGKKGILGGLTIIVGGLLGAVSGSGAATAASLGQVAVPELRKFGFNKELAGAIAAASGSLSGIIPPSLILIIFGMFAEIPIGKLFMGAIIPGIIVLISYILVMTFFLMRQKGEEVEKFEKKPLPMKRAITGVIVTFYILIIIFGGIYTGFTTPTEAAALGAFGALIACLVLGKVNKIFFINSIMETVKVTGMVVVIFVGAKLLSRFMSASLLPRKLVEGLGTLTESPGLLLTLITIFLFILFMFIEGGAVILMTLPVLLPIIEVINVDPVWFGVFVGVLCTLGLITPPVGLSVFTVSGVTRIPVEGIFKYGIVFAAISTIITVTLMIIFPDIVLWLPNNM